MCFLILYKLYIIMAAFGLEVMPFLICRHFVVLVAAVCCLGHIKNYE